MHRTKRNRTHYKTKASVEHKCFSYDDGNISNGDGWSSICTIESGYTWTTASPSVWIKLWGNGVVNTGEACDDGNTSNGDGWSSTWYVENGNAWNGSPSSCSVKCGDGLIMGSEQWDDGNTSNGDGWSSTWQVKTNWICSGTPSVWHKWGNGAIDPNEGCDDGNNINGDGCSSTWTIESGWTWQTLSYSRWNKSSNLNMIKSWLSYALIILWFFSFCIFI